jgi:hypothetical protein
MGTMLAGAEWRHIMIDLVESILPFDVEGLLDDCPFSVRPRSSFDRQQSHSDSGVRLGCGHVVELRKGKQRDQMPRKWTSEALLGWEGSTLVRRRLPSHLGTYQEFKVMDSLFQLNHADLQ